MTSVIELAGVSKVYRRYSGRQFATLKSALLQAQANMNAIGVRTCVMGSPIMA